MSRYRIRGPAARRMRRQFGWLMGVQAGRGRVAGHVVAVLLGLTCVLAPARAHAQMDSVTVTPGPHYGAGALRRFFAGAGYRNVWITAIRVAIADLDALGGGLTPLRGGGGATTQTLHLGGRDGRHYVLRTVDKTVAQGLSEELRGTLYEAVLQDQISAFLPTGALIVPPLLEAVGVLHSSPELLLIPDAPRLEEFRGQFAGQLAWFEERPDDREDSNPGFYGAVRVASTPRLFEHLRDSPLNQVVGVEYLKARLIDLLVGDRDRSVNNWLWGRFDTAEGRLYRPIPRDRDQAFIRLDGALKYYLRWYEPRLVRFSDDAPAVAGLSRSAWDMDRRFLVRLERSTWNDVVRTTKAALTDDVIESAVARLPPEHQTIVGGRLVQSLKARRDRLDDAADALYAIVNQAADVQATDEDEIASVIFEEDGTVTTTLAVAGGAPYFHRSFHAEVTREIRLYLLGGNDSVFVGGRGPARITVRVVGGSGRDRFVDATRGARPPRFYDAGDASSFVGDIRTRIHRETFEPPISWGETSANTPDWGTETRPIIALPYRGDLGFFPSVGLVHTRYGFRKDPFHTRDRLTVAYAPSLAAARVAHQHDRVLTADRTRLQLETYWSGLELIRYHGLGNDTRAGVARDSSRLHHERAAFSPSLLFLRGPLQLRVSTQLRRSVTDTTGTSLLAEEQPYGTGTFVQVGASVGVSIDTRDDDVAPAHGLRASADFSYTPALFSVDRGSFAAVDAALAAFVSTPGERHTMAVRTSGRKLFGEFPIQDAAFLGGPESLRGFRINRFAGEASALGSVELRSRVGGVQLLFPDEVGLLAFADAGRVVLDGRSPGGWHTAFGGGLWIAPVSRRHTISLSGARSREHSAVFLTAGFAF